MVSCWKQFTALLPSAEGHPWKVLLFKAGLFYADFASDVLYAKLLWDKGLGGIAYIVIAILAAPPVVLSAVDLGGSGSHKGLMVFLNCTNTRMLYTLLLPLIGDTSSTVAHNSGSSLKLFEAVLEAM